MNNKTRGKGNLFEIIQWTISIFICGRKTIWVERNQNESQQLYVQSLCQNFLNTYLLDHKQIASYFSDTETQAWGAISYPASHKTQWETTKVHLHGHSGWMGMWWKEACTEEDMETPKSDLIPPGLIQLKGRRDLSPSLTPGPQAHSALPWHEVWHWESMESLLVAHSGAQSVWEAIVDVAMTFTKPWPHMTTSSHRDRQ